MEEMLNSRRHKKLTKKLPKGQTTSPKDGTNFEKVLVEKMEPHNWTLLIASKICKKETNVFHKCHSSDLIFKNNHGNPSSGELYYNTQSGQANYDDTIFRDSHRSCSIKERS